MGQGRKIMWLLDRAEDTEAPIAVINGMIWYAGIGYTGLRMTCIQGSGAMFSIILNVLQLAGSLQVQAANAIYNIEYTRLFNYSVQHTVELKHPPTTQPWWIIHPRIRPFN